MSTCDFLELHIARLPPPQSLTYNPGDTSGYLTGMGYNIAGEITGLTLGNGVAETFGYDANRLQLTSQVATKSGGPTGGLMNLNYYYQASAGQMGSGSTAGNAGQLMAINDNSTINGTTESADYTYDNLGRLATSTQTSNGSSGQRTYSFDRWGNRTAAYDDNKGIHQIQSIALQQNGGAPTNRITSVTNNGTPSNYLYDAAGNVTNDGVHTYQYDAENRLVSVDSGATAQYKYDHQNRRVSKIIGSSWTHYVWQGGQVIGEHDATTTYTTNPTYQVNSARLDYIYSGSQRIYSRERASSGGSWTTKYYLSDRLSTRLVLDTSGNVLGRQGHLPFAADFGESGTQEKHHFTSYERDGESGTDYAVNRQYSQSMGRFMSVDPKAGSVERPESLNRYAYVRNDPINKIDPDGRDLAIIGGRLYLINCSSNVRWVGEWDDGEWDADPSNGETCELVDLGSIGSPGNPTQGYTPCGALGQIPTDPGERDAVAMLLGEGTSLGRLDQAQYQDDDRLGQPTGQYAITSTDLSNEAEAMVNVVANRANSSGRTWQQVINQPGQFAGLEAGRRKLDELIRKGSYTRRQLPEGSEECAQLYDAVNAVYNVKNYGPTSNFLYWVGAFNPGYRGGQYARQRRPGDTRIADTDFSANPF